MKEEDPKHYNYRKGLWTEEEDRVLSEYIRVHGRGHWNRIPKVTGLRRCGKSCRLRWLNYLSPTVKRGGFSGEEEDLIIRLHKLLGNRWSLIAGRVPGRTDNQVKNHWNTHLSKRLGIKNKKPKINKPINTCSSHHQPDCHELPSPPTLEDSSNLQQSREVNVNMSPDGEPDLVMKTGIITGESPVGHYDPDSLLLVNTHFDLGFFELFDSFPFDMVARNH